MNAPSLIISTNQVLDSLFLKALELINVVLFVLFAPKGFICYFLYCFDFGILIFLGGVNSFQLSMFGINVNVLE
jgi:hypothetical protein